MSERSKIPPTFASTQTEEKMACVSEQLHDALAPLAEAHDGDALAQVLVGNLMVINGIGTLQRKNISREDLHRVVAAMIDASFDTHLPMPIAMPEALAMQNIQGIGGVS